MLFLAACTGGGGTGPTAVPSSITLSPATVTFSSLTATQGLTATVKDASGATISGASVAWSTNASSVATVSTTGLVTAVGNGTAQITATSGTVQASADVTVEQVAATLTLSPDTIRLAGATDTATIAATVRDALGSSMTEATVTFTTSDPSIATVNAAGRVTAVSDGGTTVIGEVAPGGSSLTRSVRVEVGSVLPPAYLVGGYAGTAYSDQVGPVSGGTGFTYSVTNGALPNGLSLNASTAQVTGIPSVSGVFFFEVTATNGVVSPSERYAITISTKSASAFNLWVAYNGGPMPPTNARTALNAALARWETVIAGDAGAAVTYPSSGLDPTDCSLVDASLLNGAFIEDFAILIALGPIDGLGKTLARGGPCGYGRQVLPASITGQMLLDEVDAAAASATYLQQVVWHEIAHALGKGTLWFDSVTGVGTPTPKYFGTVGNAEWRALGGASDGVPLEPDLGAHWAEAWFNEEIMTPTTEGPLANMPISRMTIGALIDLGWGGVLTAADAYTLPACAGSCSVGPAPTGAPGEDRRIPDFVIDPLLPLPPGALAAN